jgi:hypothetical protein
MKYISKFITLFVESYKCRKKEVLKERKHIHAIKINNGFGFFSEYKLDINWQEPYG